MIVTLQRLGYKNPHGTFGVLSIDNSPQCVTLEPSWKNNQQDISCIPEGVYLCREIESPRHGHTYEVTDVEGRTHIVFHVGNTLKDTLGCILVGTQFGAINGIDAILDSRSAFSKLI